MESGALLRPWQREFVERYTVAPRRRSLLIAAPGSGKTRTALVTARRLIDGGLADFLLVLSNRQYLRDAWRAAAAAYGLQLGSSVTDHREVLAGDGLSLTVQTLQAMASNREPFHRLVGDKQLFIVVDSMGSQRPLADPLVELLLHESPGSRVLHVGSGAIERFSFDQEFVIDYEYIADRRIITDPRTVARFAQVSPSLLLLEKLLRSPAALDGLTWREFERLVATLLEHDGFTIELTRGTKDGGVDVIAEKVQGAAGPIRTIWQAKKKGAGNKVGISVIRELADTRNEFNASKGLIITTSYLTRDALARVERDKYILGKVDRSELNAWINRVLLRGS